MVVALLVGAAPVYADDPHPGGSQSSAAELNAAKQQAAEDRHKLALTRAAEASAQNRLTVLAAAAEKATRRYKAALVRLQDARKAAVAARTAAAAAAARADAQQRQVDAFVRASYMSGGPLTAIAVILDSGDPTRILDQASLLNAVSRTQSQMLAELDRAREVQATLAHEAQVATSRVERVTMRADAARRSAIIAMANQHALIGRLAQKRVKVAKQLADHQAQVVELTTDAMAAQVRQQVAAQRAALAAAWDELKAAGEAMPWATKKQGKRAVKWAKKQLGVPYSWAGGDYKGPTLGTVNEEGNPAGLHTVGFDCSGLALYAWAHAGFRLDHYTGYQYLEGHQIPLEKLRAGDLVFFAKDVTNPLTIHHVGIYVGHGKMIDAPHTGAVVRYDKVFVPGLIGAVRP